MLSSNLLASMQVFITVVDSGSFSEAARRLGLSQPSVSRQVNSLEAHLNVRLLQRTTRCLNLTEAGQLYYEKARDVQRRVMDAHQAVSGFHDTPSGLLRISAPHTWMEEKIAPYLGEFLNRFPAIKLEIQCDDNLQDMVADQLDLVIRVGRLVDSSYIAVPFADVRLVLCATPGYLAARGEPKTIADLSNHPFITYKQFRSFICSTGKDHQALEVESRLASHSVAAAIGAVQQDLGLAVLPDLLISAALENGTLVSLMPEYRFDIKGLPVEQMFALYPSRKQMPPKVRAFIDFYREKLAS